MLCRDGVSTDIDCLIDWSATNLDVKPTTRAGEAPSFVDHLALSPIFSSSMCITAVILLVVFCSNFDGGLAGLLAFKHKVWPSQHQWLRFVSFSPLNVP